MGGSKSVEIDGFRVAVVCLFVVVLFPFFLGQRMADIILFDI